MSSDQSGEKFTVDLRMHGENNWQNQVDVVLYKESAILDFGEMRLTGEETKFRILRYVTDDQIKKNCRKKIIHLLDKPYRIDIVVALVPVKNVTNDYAMDYDYGGTHSLSFRDDDSYRAAIDELEGMKRKGVINSQQPARDCMRRISGAGKRKTKKMRKSKRKTKRRTSKK